CRPAVGGAGRLRGDRRLCHGGAVALLGGHALDRDVRRRRGGRRAGRRDRLSGIPLRAARLLLRAAHGGLRRDLPDRRPQHRRDRGRGGPLHHLHRRSTAVPVPEPACVLLHRARAHALGHRGGLDGRALAPRRLPDRHPGGRGAAEALGIDTFRCKLYASVLSGFLTGLGGAFHAFYYFSLQPNSLFGIPLSVEIIIRPIVGGAGTLLGPILGSFILSPLAELSRTYFAAAGWSGAHLIAYGALLVAVVLFLPQGAYPYLARRARRSRASG